jgi:hypothetical protein
MKIKMLESLGTPKECFEQGHEYEVSDRIGAAWIRSGIAVEVTPTTVQLERPASKTKASRNPSTVKAIREPSQTHVAA